MPRRKFRNSQRHSSSSDRSFQEYLLNQPSTQTTRSELLRLIRGGEDSYLELKVKLSNPERIAQEVVALANTAGGTMIFGITDQLRVEGLRNPEGVQEDLARICRDDVFPPLLPVLDTIAFDNGRRIVALDISGNDRPYRTKEGKFYIRIGAEKREATREELSSLIGEARPLRYENVTISGLSGDDFDDSLLWSFANAFDNELAVRDLYDTETFLKRDLLLAAGSRDDFLPTIAGLLLFGKSEVVGERLPQSSVTVARVSGKDFGGQLVERHQIEGNLLHLFESVVEFIEQYADLKKHKGEKADGDSPVPSRRSYHLYSVKEAVANLLIHRDLALPETETKVTVFDDSIEFLNPRRTGGFVPPASRAIRYGITQRMNPQIASVFLRREYGLRLPQGGLPMLIKQSRLFSGRRIELQTANDVFRLRIYGSG